MRILIQDRHKSISPPPIPIFSRTISQSIITPKAFRRFSRLAFITVGTLVTAVVGTILGPQEWHRPSAAITSRMPVSLALIVNHVTSGPTVDLPPLDQKPVLYAELTLDGERLRTGTEQTPQIGSRIYPDWALYVEKDAIWIERGHFIDATIRIFDQDDGDADDKVLLAAIAFDPIACQANLGANVEDIQLEGDRQGSTCSLTIPELQGENGQAKITLTSAW